MEGSDALSALAEVAIGITGFAAIALVLIRSRDSLSPHILLVIRTLIVNGMFVAFLALFPRVLASGTLPPTEVWRWSRARNATNIPLVRAGVQFGDGIQAKRRSAA